MDETANDRNGQPNNQGDDFNEFPRQQQFTRTKASENEYGSATALRILCLHDHGSNAKHLSDRLEALGERLYEKHGIDLVYINSPLLATASSSTSGRFECDHEDDDPASPGFVEGGGPRRVWWNLADNDENASPSHAQQQPQQTPTNNLGVDISIDDSDDEDDDSGADPLSSMSPPTVPSTTTSETATSASSANVGDRATQHSGSASGSAQPPAPATRKFIGLDASIMLLRQVWTSTMPFWGILAFGKAAGVASFLPLLPVEPTPSFMIFVQGESILQDDEVLIDSIPCFHIVDESNHDRSELLVRQFGGTVKASNSRFGVKTVNAIGKFLVDQKKELHKDGETGNILALQNQIYLVEQEAAMVVAKAIAKNPPKPLMAVIQPQNIAGPNIDSRMRPGERGGGAPCPAEFLMKREKRGERAGAGPSRHHPSAAPAAKTAESAADNANPATPDEEESNKTT